jgi:hypothetical protein
MHRTIHYLKSDDGAILGMIMVFFLVITIIGSSLLSLASHEIMLSRREIQKTQAYYNAESGLNIAIWRINQGIDGGAAFTSDTISAEIDTINLRLTATGNSGNYSATLTWDLFEDDVFQHIISFGSLLDTSNYTITSMSFHEISQFDELPAIDMFYYLSIADYVYYSDQIFNSTLADGIHFINGHVWARNGTQLDGTLIATNGILFTGHVSISAQLIPDTTIYYPAIISYDSTYTEENEITGLPNLTVFGAVYSNNFIRIRGSTLSGPIIAPEIKLRAGAVIDDLGNPQYYATPPGFENPQEQDLEKLFKAGSWRRLN